MHTEETEEEGKEHKSWERLYGWSSVASQWKGMLDEVLGWVCAARG